MNNLKFIYVLSLMFLLYTHDKQRKTWLGNDMGKGRQPSVRFDLLVNHFIIIHRYLTLNTNTRYSDGNRSGKKCSSNS
jgi:hypothetical protein